MSDTYHHGALADAVRAAAIELVERDGPAGLSMREVARKAGVSHTAPKHHFGSKQGLLTTLAIEGFDLLIDAMDRAAADADDPVERVVRQVAAYVEMHRANRGHAALMWRWDVVDVEDPRLAAASAEAFRRLHAGVAAVVGPAEAFGVAVECWVAAHGAATLAERLTPGLTNVVGADPFSLRAPEEIASHLVAAVLAQRSGKAASTPSE